MSLSTSEIREKFIKYYKDKGHEVVPSASLIPENDPTTLFINSGMQPMLQYFLGAPYPSGADKIVNSQKCFRSVDIEEVGDSHHTTFFEMLGNWSFGDYWKKEQLRFIFEFLVDKLNLNPQKLYVTLFEGDEKNGISKDEESEKIWRELFKEKGIDAKIGDRIVYHDAKENWWSRLGTPEEMPIGEPGGPDSEVFYKFDIEHNPEFGSECYPGCDCGKYIEIANSVFMEFKKVGESKFEKLPKKNVDFGGGLERMAAAVNNDPDMFMIDLLNPAIKVIEEMSDKKYEGDYMRPMQVIADHLRGATFMIVEGVRPNNKQQGYVLRRLIRRAAVKMHLLRGGLTPVPGFRSVCEEFLKIYDNVYFDRQRDKDVVAEVLDAELDKFGKTLDKGLKLFEKAAKEELDGELAFDLFQTYGFPFEITDELARQKGIFISREEFDQARGRHRDLSRTSSAGSFKGGLGDTDEKSIWYHTLTHLLHQALRDVLGDEVKQAGSNITSERLRFDFGFDRALEDEELEEVEKIVNEQKNKDLEVTMESMDIQSALDAGARALFKEKYEGKVNVYSIGDYSKEVCGGPHVKNTSEIKGSFKIVKEKSSGAGVRRIRALVE